MMHSNREECKDIMVDTRDLYDLLVQFSVSVFLLRLLLLLFYLAYTSLVLLAFLDSDENERDSSHCELDRFAAA